MNYHKKFVVEPGARLRLGKIDPSFTGKHDAHDKAKKEIEKQVERMRELQYLLYADGTRSLLIVLQALDAGGKDGVIGHLFSGMNPQGTFVVPFKRPTAEEAAHDFLWRTHRHAPARGQVVIFNRSHYEDVLVTRVHETVPRALWSKRYDIINAFENALIENGTKILKFYLHISPEEQLERFKDRLDDPERRWKISEDDYSERKLWPKYIEAYEDAMMRTSTQQAPWYVIPANHKWFRNLAISHIVADTMDDMGLTLPRPHVDLAEIRRKFHAAEVAQRDGKPARLEKSDKHKKSRRRRG
ncbi:MAG TPA: polyphosphate kinase 2 family protein [Pseudolabrys sp.]|nr:polyphosphate kinase 2 family protein [Pseudolabrys sp.]